jgi:hypothetical protein
VTAHTGAIGWAVDRSSPSSFVANHLGHFAQSHHLFCRGVFLGGVTQRFPALNFGFLEGGSGWACNLFSDLVGHWEKRNRPAMLRQLKPTNLDRDELRRLFETYAASEPRYSGKVDEILARNLDLLDPGRSQEELAARDETWDEFGAVQITNKADIRRLFLENFYFGCEADDPITAWSFDRRLDIPVKSFFGSDISHFDVVDMTEVLEEAYELVEHELITEQDFRRFTFTNAVLLHGRMNPDFFKGTVVEAAAQAELAANPR